jgi:16S rRNA G966 N2-methylase RsmD
MIHDFLNIRNSLRNLSDERFEEILPQLAQELEQVSFYTIYNNDDLKKDWIKLCEWDPYTTTIASTQRLGMKLCEHFFPNFYDIEDKKGNSFKSLWTAKNLEKVLRWNRKSHSTPYLSEIKRGIYFNFGLAKSTMYRPQMAKMIVANLNASRVFDPCAGWGGRLLGSIAAGANTYIAFEPNTETYNGLQNMVQFLNIQDKVHLYKDSALNMKQYPIQNMDIVLTSPPYFNLEVYSHEESQSITGCTSYAMWMEQFLTPLIQQSATTLRPNGWSCWNVHNVGKMKMINDVAALHAQYPTTKEFTVTSSKRQSNQYTASKNQKNLDRTICYSAI